MANNSPTPSAKDIIGIVKELQKMEKKAAGGPWDGCNHIKDHSFDGQCKCRQATIWSIPLDTIICEKYENRDGSGPDPVTRECELNTMSFILELRNAFPSIAQALLDREEKLKIAVEQLERIEDMKCIQHMPSCSDIATNALLLLRLSPLP